MEILILIMIIFYIGVRIARWYDYKVGFLNRNIDVLRENVVEYKNLNFELKNKVEKLQQDIIILSQEKYGLLIQLHQSQEKEKELSIECEKLKNSHFIFLNILIA